MKNVVITGVSSGIGYAAAVELTAAGYRIFGSVRTESDAARLCANLGKRFTPLLFDVTDEDAVGAAATEVAAATDGAGLFGLVNNAGVAVVGPVQYLNVEEFRHQFEVNVLGLLGVTKAFLPLLGVVSGLSHPPGRIINISSVSGRIAYPFLAPYAASKHAVEALSDSLRRELLIYGIDVIVIQPGSVQTPIWDKAAQIDINRYTDSPYHPILRRLHHSLAGTDQRGIAVERVSSTIRTALEHPRPRSRYRLTANGLTGWYIPRWTPTRLFDRLIGHRLGMQIRPDQ